MSHVDEGVLHAYLDGGLSALDAVRVERHVADCGPCRQRLDQARALIQRAARLLEWASPPADRAAPPLADLRPAAAPRWRVPVAWAATIVIALGAGIYGGGAVLRGGGGESDRRTSGGPAELYDSSRADAVESRAEPITVLAAAESTQRQTEAKTRAAGPVTEDRAVSTVGSQDSNAAMNRVALTPNAKAPVDTARAPIALDGVALGARRETQPAPATAAAPAPIPAADSLADRARLRGFAAPQATITGAAEGVAYRRAADAAPVWPQIAVDSARVLLGTAPVSVPDLPVTAIRTMNGVVAVEQVVPPGRVIKLLQRRAQTDEEQVRTLSDLLARYVDGLRVEISGPMAADSLSRLLERARAIP